MASVKVEHQERRLPITVHLQCSVIRSSCDSIRIMDNMTKSILPALPTTLSSKKNYIQDAEEILMIVKSPIPFLNMLKYSQLSTIPLGMERLRHCLGPNRKEDPSLRIGRTIILFSSS